MKKAFLLVAFSCLTLVSCNSSPVNKLYSIDVNTKLFDVNMRTYFDHKKQVVEASVKDSSDTKYLIYLVNQKGVVTNSGTTSNNREVVFTDIKSDSILYVSKAFNSSLVETGVNPIIINDLYPDYYNGDFSNKVETKINELKINNAYTVDKPLLIYNAYGTDELSMYCYFNSEEETIINYQIVTTNHRIFSRDVRKDFNSETAYGHEHEFTAHGMIAGELNYILVNSYKNITELQDSYYISYQPKTLEEMDSAYVDKKVECKKLSSTPLLDGLFVFSLGVYKLIPYRFTHTVMMDNDGDIRWFIPMNDHFFINMFIQEYENEKCLVYVIDFHQLVFVNYLGQTKKIVTLLCDDNFNEGGKYTYFAMHHDFCFDNEGNILLLADPCEAIYIDEKNDKRPKTLYKYVLKYDLSNDTITVPLYIDKCIFTTYQEYAKSQYTTYPEDWFHVNTVQFISESDGDYLTLSSRESSAVLRVKLADEWESESDTPSIMPTIKWTLTGNQNIINKETSVNFLTRREDSPICLPNLGQHTTYIIKENIFPTPLESNQYYLAMFSNNTEMNSSGNIWDYSGVPQSEFETIDKYSKNRIYLIDESTNTYKVIYDSNVSPACKWMSSFTYYSGHWICDCVEGAHIYEKDLYGNELVHISIEKAQSYRAFKFNL